MCLAYLHSFGNLMKFCQIFQMFSLFAYSPESSNPPARFCQNCILSKLHFLGPGLYRPCLGLLQCPSKLLAGFNSIQITDPADGTPVSGSCLANLCRGVGLGRLVENESGLPFLGLSQPSHFPLHRQHPTRHFFLFHKLKVFFNFSVLLPLMERWGLSLDSRSMPFPSCLGALWWGPSAS